MGIKQRIKQLFPSVVRCVRGIKKLVGDRKRRQYNRDYRRSIEMLYDPDVLKEKIDLLFKKIRNETELTYYIVATENTKLGIFGYINCFLPHIAYAIAKGYVPVIDMKHFGSIYQVSDENVWETFFEQPFNIGLDGIGNGHAILCPTSFWYQNLPNSFPLMNEKEITLWGNCAAACIRYNAVSQSYLEQELSTILKAPERTIGVIYRGTTYTKGHAKGHPIQPTMKMLAEKAEEMMTRNGCEYLYIASDEKSIVDYFENRFPGRVLVNKRVYYDEVSDHDFSRYNIDGTDLDSQCFSRENNEYLIGIEYISSINLIAHCSFFVGGACGGTTAALYLNNLHFREWFVFQLGRYGQDAIPEE